MEYIDREAAIEAISKLEFVAMDVIAADSINGAFQIVTRYMDKQLRKLPAADVRPVVKAKWAYTDMSRLVCSNCGNPVAFSLKEDGWHHGDYCPNCGAKMEES